MKRWFQVAWLVLAVALMFGCGIKIETGQTSEEATESSERRAKQSRSDWARLLDQTPEEQQPRAVARLIDTTASRYVEFGYRIDEQWRQAETGLGKDVTAVQMQEVIDGWVSAERPILDGWDDNIVYGLETVKSSKRFDRVVIDLLEAQYTQFQELYSAVMFPSGSRSEYLDRVLESSERLKYMNRELSLKLESHGY